MVSWRKMEGPILLTLLMLGFVVYLVGSPYFFAGRVLSLSGVDFSSPVAVTALVVRPVANPVERIALPKTSLFR